MDDKDIAIILNLISSPSSSNKEIAQTTGMSQATVSRRVRKLSKEGILEGKELKLNRSKLGLDMYSLIIVPKEPWTRNCILLQLYFKHHAYTAYQNRVFGAENALFVQLNTPPGTESAIQSLKEELIDNELIDDLQVFKQSADQFRYAIDTSKYNMDTRSFDIDYDYIRKLMKADYSQLELGETSRQDELLDRRNIKVISALFRDASRSLKEIGESIGMSKQEVSRRRIALDLDDWGYSILYDRKQFGVFNQALYVLNLDTRSMANLDHVLKDVYPFQASVIPNAPHILLWINLPAVDVMEFTNLLKYKFTLVKMYLFSRRPLSYGPWSLNLVDGEWLDDEDRITGTFNRDYTELLQLHDFLRQHNDNTVDELERML